MPEIPDLDAIVSYLRPRIIGEMIEEVTAPLAWMIRSSLPEGADGVEAALEGETFESVERSGKYILFGLQRATLSVHSMLAGRFYYVLPEASFPRAMVLQMVLSTGMALRYADEKQMGRIYLTPEREYGAIPGFNEQGPNPLAEDFTFDKFLERLKGRYGEVKGLLTNAKVISGIGNAYADEILFEAGIYPFRKKKELSDAELRRLYDAIPAVLNRAKEIVADRMGEQIHLKIRDFLSVHGKKDKGCPRCGQRISTVGTFERATNFCRRCQPGLMTDRPKKRDSDRIAG